MSRKQDLIDWAKGIGLGIYERSGFKGGPFYRFGPLGSSYYAVNSIGFTIGILQAETWLDGYVEGRKSTEKEGKR